MVIDKEQIFNLMDTNGRRSDVLNALKVYLETLEELKNEYPTEKWDRYPNSTSQFIYYEKVLEKSRDVFKKHDNYDRLIDELGSSYRLFLSKDTDWIKSSFPKFKKSIDEAVEKRARHYTSNLVKIGFCDSVRNITEAGYSYLKNTVRRDALEELLPLDNINIVLIRQLLKMKIFSNPDNDGKRKFYSPFHMAVALLLSREVIERHSFEAVIQGLGPYSSDAVKEYVMKEPICTKKLESLIADSVLEVPDELNRKSEIDFELFRQYFKSSKSNDSTIDKYYKFYISLKMFREDKCEDNYKNLLHCFENDSAILQKAFGNGKSVFDIGNKGKRYDLKTFAEKNSDNILLNCGNYTKIFYTVFSNSKHTDGIREYSDTTMRLLGATGLFKLKNLPDLAYRDVIAFIFNNDKIKSGIFGEMTQEQYLQYEIEDNCFFCGSSSITEILNYSACDIDNIMHKIESRLGAGSSYDVKAMLQGSKNNDFICHVNEKYPKEKIMELLPLFSDRKNDSKIKNEVNDSATIPTIYEYIIGIAWYYISNREFNLYNSLNLTLDADFEPLIHAGGGDGDIVIDYEDISVMLEVSLMNKQAQKRGEWEPVLRHSLNLKASNEPKETITFFIADELDHNTVNIWRAVASVFLESTTAHTMVDGVIIMPFTNCEILQFLKNNTYYKKIIKIVKDSYKKVPRITNVKWHDEILYDLFK